MLSRLVAHDIDTAFRQYLSIRSSKCTTKEHVQRLGMTLMQNDIVMVMELQCLIYCFCLKLAGVSSTWIAAGLLNVRHFAVDVVGGGGRSHKR